MINDSDFQKAMKLGYVKAITDMLFERDLITPAEVENIDERLEALEMELLSPKPRMGAPKREISQIGY